MRAFARRTLGFLPLLSLLLLFNLSAFKDAAAKPCGNCPEFYCEDPSPANKLKAEKKRRAESRGLPSRLSVLFNQLANCEGCVKTAPDWPHISWNIDPDGYQKKFGHKASYTSISRPWDADTEMRLRQDLRDGVIKDFHVYLGQDKCKCCPNGATKDEYKEWQTAGERATEEDPQWNKDKDFTDDAPQQNFTDKDKLGEDPRDLTELPPEKRRPQSLRDPGTHEEPALRYVHVMCRECSELEEKYNEDAKKINDARHDIAQMKRHYSLSAQGVTNIENEMARTNRLAQTPEVQKKHDELMTELGHKLGDHQKLGDKLKAALAEDKALRDELKTLMEHIQECEKNKCKKAAVEEPKTAVKVPGGDTAPKTDTKPKDAAPPSVGEVTEPQNLSLDAISKRTSNCPKCTVALQEYHEAGMHWAHLKEAAEDMRDKREDALRAARFGFEKGDNPKGGLSTADWQAKLIQDIYDQFDPLIDAYNRAADAAKPAMDAALAKLVECEKQCAPGATGTTGVVGGGGTGKPVTGWEGPSQAFLPFPWDGPYNTNCAPCRKLADELNRLPKLAQDQRFAISWREQLVSLLEDLLANHAVDAASYVVHDMTKERSKFHFSTDEDVTKFDLKTADQIREYIDTVKVRIEIAKRNLERITQQFNTVLAMLQDCEKKYCSGTGTRTAVRVGGDAKVELEQTVKVTGTDPFNPRDVEDAGVNGGTGTSVTPPTSPPVTTPPVTTPPVTTPPVTTPPTTTPPTTTPPVTSPPLLVTTSGSFSFAHTVGSSSCPQNAGSATVTSNNGHVLSVSGISVSGSIQPKLTVTAGANGTTVTISASFNCSSPANGTFTGTVSATVTDTVTGETRVISIAASGTVTG